MGRSRVRGRESDGVIRRLPAGRPGAAIIAALAVTDLVYRLLMREPLRRKLGMETRHA